MVLYAFLSSLWEFLALDSPHPDNLDILAHLCLVSYKSIIKIIEYNYISMEIEGSHVTMWLHRDKYF